MNDNLSANGDLIVKVSTARGAIPLENAAVSIRSNSSSDGGILYSLSTNSDGQTPRISLPTVPKSASIAPGNPTPYATYSIDVFQEGYVPLWIPSVPIFDSILSIQPAIMVPLPEGVSDLRFPPSAAVSEEKPYDDL